MVEDGGLCRNCRTVSHDCGTPQGQHKSDEARTRMLQERSDRDRQSHVELRESTGAKYHSQDPELTRKTMVLYNRRQPTEESGWQLINQLCGGIFPDRGDVICGPVSRNSQTLRGGATTLPHNRSALCQPVQSPSLRGREA